MSNYRNATVIENEQGEWKLGAVTMWKDYDAYVKLTKAQQQICFNVSNPKWIKHFNYLLYHKKKN